MNTADYPYPLPTTNPCPSWCTETEFHPYDCENTDASWSREHQAYEWGMRLCSGRQIRLCVYAEEYVYDDAHASPVARRPVLHGDSDQPTTLYVMTPAEARQYAAALADASSHLETALLQWSVSR